jgi:hypothetical protein
LKDVYVLCIYIHSYCWVHMYVNMYVHTCACAYECKLTSVDQDTAYL